MSDELMSDGKKELETRDQGLGKCVNGLRPNALTAKGTKKAQRTQSKCVMAFGQLDWHTDDADWTDEH